jgi:hypothetical protein
MPHQWVTTREHSSLDYHFTEGEAVTLMKVTVHKTALRNESGLNFFIALSLKMEYIVNR